MTPPSQRLASVARVSLSSSPRPSPTCLPRFLAPSAGGLETRRYISEAQLNAQRKMVKREKEKIQAASSRTKLSKQYPLGNLDRLEQFSLCDAMRYIRAFEVGRPPSHVKYDVAIHLRSNRNGRPVRNRITLPHPVKMQNKIVVICAEGSKTAAEALAAGAVAAGEESVFAQIRGKKIKFNKVIAHPESMPALIQAKMGPILRTLMPSPRTKTVSTQVAKLMREMSSSEAYKENVGTIRMCIGQLGFTPQMLAENVRAVLDSIKSDIRDMAHQSANEKEVHEVVLSSTNGPGLSLDGGFAPSDPQIGEEHLAGPM